MVLKNGPLVSKTKFGSSNIDNGLVPTKDNVVVLKKDNVSLNKISNALIFETTTITLMGSLLAP